MGTAAPYGPRAAERDRHGAFAEAERASSWSPPAERVRKRVGRDRDSLTASRSSGRSPAPASDGLSNPRFGARSSSVPRTRRNCIYAKRVFAKLGITSRKQLRAALPERDSDAAAV